MAVASDWRFANNLHLGPDRQPCQYHNFHSGGMLFWRPTSNVKALKKMQLLLHRNKQREKIDMILNEIKQVTCKIAGFWSLSTNFWRSSLMWRLSIDSSRRAYESFAATHSRSTGRLRPFVCKFRHNCCQTSFKISNIHTYIHPFNGPFSGTTQVSRYQKGKTNLDFTEARDSEWRWHQLGHMQVCNSLQTDNHASTPPLSFLQVGCPSCHPTNSVKALKALATESQTATHGTKTRFGCH